MRNLGTQGREGNWRMRERMMDLNTEGGLLLSSSESMRRLSQADLAESVDHSCKRFWYQLGSLFCYSLEQSLRA